MLGKLLKHEFRATGRIMGPLYLVMLALALCANISARVLDASRSRLLNVLGGLVIAAFVIAIIGTCVMALVLMINRFRTNLMSDEGYVMFTLPVSVHQLVWSKIIVSTVWFAATFLAVGFSGLVASFRLAYVDDFISRIGELFRQITAYYAINGAAFLAEALVLAFVGCAALCLLFYASMSVGHSFANHKTLLSVVCFFAFQFATQMVGTLGILGLGDIDFVWRFSNMAAIHAAMGAAIISALVYGAIFYVVTVLMLKKHLNLE